MKVTILEPSGYCAGVERAMNLAIETKKKNPHERVVILGMLVHNKASLKVLKKHHIKTIYRKDCSLEQLATMIKKPSLVILSAHGHSEKVEKILLSNGHKIIDSTCPFVKNSFKEISKAVKEKKKIFYIGVENHPESTAALSISNNVTLIDIKHPVIPSDIKEEILVISQTTLSKYETEEVNNLIKKAYPKATFTNSICDASTRRQDSIKKISNDTDLIYIVGDANSNNSKTLYSLAKQMHKNMAVKQIETAKDIKKKDLIGLSHIVIASGASTPKEVIESVKNKLLN